VASWTFGGLEAGKEYQVVATWLVDPGNTASVTLRMLDGTTVLSTQQLDQTELDADLTIHGHAWQRLGIVTVSADNDLVVELDPTGATGLVVADAVRLVTDTTQYT